MLRCFVPISKLFIIMIPGLTTVNEEYNFMSIPSPWFGHSLFGSYLMDAQGLLQMYFDKAKPPTDTVQLETIASPSLSTRKSFYSYKHKYSPLDLEKAVRDVRSGRLGTRKASIVYGIPRSTLRNKVYRIESITDKDFMQDNSSNISFNKNSSEIDKVANSESTWAKNSFFHKLLNNSSLNIMKNSCGQSILSGSSTASGGTSEIRPQLNNSLPENNIFSNLFQCERSFISPDLLKIMNDLAVLAPSATLTENTSFTKIKKNENDLWKKSRPKRGQYRKYDKSALDEAVKCVRLGEMSVHKAGSVYGVPHSTLEYKVKERNLLKKRKLSSETRDKTREESEHLETENTNKTHCK